MAGNSVIQHLGFPPPAERQGASQGWNEPLDRLLEYLGDA